MLQLVCYIFPLVIEDWKILNGETEINETYFMKFISLLEFVFSYLRFM